MSKGSEYAEAVEQVARHYKNFHPRWNLKPKERERIVELLRCKYSAEDLCLAIDGLHLDDWHNGKNADNKKWLAFSYAFREDPMDGYIEAAKLHRDMEKSRVLRAKEKKSREKRQRDAAMEYRKRVENGDIPSLKMSRRIAEVGSN